MAAKKAAKAIKAKPRKGKVAAAVGSSAAVKGDPGLAKRIELAMSQAVAEAYAKGVTNPAKVKASMMKAREAVLKA